MKRIIAFDVNETLLDLAALDPVFATMFIDKSKTKSEGGGVVRREWFAQMLQSALVSIVTDAYSDFSTLQMGALEIIATRRSITLTEANRARVRDGMRTLPPHADVRPGLERLRDAGFTLVTLTNSPPEVAEAQIANAGLTEFFAMRFSADTVRRLKPAPAPYRMVAAHFGVPIGQVRLVAAHAWDIAGAVRAGCVTAFVGRLGAVLDPLVSVPDIVAPTVDAVAERIITVDGAQ